MCFYWCNRLNLTYEIAPKFQAAKIFLLYLLYTSRANNKIGHINYHNDHNSLSDFKLDLMMFKLNRYPIIHDHIQPFHHDLGLGITNGQGVIFFILFHDQGRKALNTQPIFEYETIV